MVLDLDSQSLSFEEADTAALVARHLDEWGWAVTRGVGGHVALREGLVVVAVVLVQLGVSGLDAL